MTNPISAVSGSAAYSVVSGASMRQPPAQRMASLFDRMDTSGSGTITKAQFEQAFARQNPPKGLQAMGADAVFSKLDPNGTGSVSKQDFISGMSNILSQMRGHGHHHHGGSAGGAGDLTAATQSLGATVSGGTSGTLLNTKA